MIDPEEFEPPEGWTSMSTNFAGAVADGLDPENVSYGFVAEVMAQVDAPIRIYLYPTMVVCVFLDPMYRIWRGVAVQR